MKVHNKIGSAERMKEIFQKINKTKVNESFDKKFKIKLNEDIGNELRFSKIIVDLIESELGLQLQSVGGAGSGKSIYRFNDQQDTKKFIDYIASIDGEIDEILDDGTSVIVNEITPQNKFKINLLNLEKGFNKSMPNESFDSPKDKDEKYLNKGGDKAGLEKQPNKYDDGVREPRERDIQVKDKSVEKLKGDDKPITEGVFDALRREFNDLVAGWEQLKPNTSAYRKGAMLPGGHEGGAELARLKSQKERSASDLLNKIRQYNGGGPDEAQQFGEGEEEETELEINNLDTGEEIDNVEIEDNGEESIEGGLADGESPADFDPKQILLGMEVEMEHTNNPKEALEISMDHLVEDPLYYGSEGENSDMEAQDNAAEDAVEIEDDLGIDTSEIEDEISGAEEAPEQIEDDDLRVNMNWLETIKPKNVDDTDEMSTDLGEAFGEEEEFIPQGSYTVSNSGGYEIMLNDSGDAAKVRDAYGSDNPQTSDWLEIEYVQSEEGESEPVIDPNGYNIPLNQVMRIN